jgi:hypothetical protein
MQLSKADARDLVYRDHPDFEVIQDRIIDTSRWSVHHEIVVKHTETNKFYKTTYSKGATEYQDEQPFEDDDEVILKEVIPVETAVIVYKEI